MKYLFIFLLLSLPATSSEFDVDQFLSKTYVTVGIGYKFHEAKIRYKHDNGNSYIWDDPYSARMEMGYLYSKNIKFGISHHSQWLTGFPFNSDRNEYHKTELFIDYTFTLK